MTSKPANYEMVTLAREARGWSQIELSRQSGIPQPSISKIENGLMEITPEHLAALARVLDYPESFFHRSGEQYGFGTICHHRKRNSMPIKHLRKIHAQMNVMRFATDDLLRGIDIDPANNFPRLAVEDFGSPEDVAMMLRRAWQMPAGPVNNVMRLIEAAGGVVVVSQFDTDRLDAVSQRPLHGAPFVFTSATAPGDRLRFSLAHELGHLVMHADPQPEKQAEEEADRFASEFLMPANDIKPDLKNLNIGRLADLKQYWRVSMQSLVMKAWQLGAITDNQRKSFFVRFSQLGYRKREPVQIAREEPSLIHDVIEFHRREHGYTDDDLRNTTRLSSHDFAGLYGVDLRPSLRVVAH